MTQTEIEEQLKQIELDVGVGKDGTTAKCLAAGEPYVTLGWSHTGSPIKQEGKPAVHFPTPEAAWSLWFAAFNEYRRTRKGRIHWRKRPSMNEAFSWGKDDWGPKKSVGYLVYARVFIEEDPQ